ncbi:MAG TPA: hypothetical protein VJ757_12305 [Pseudonocardiaceae bacterium]|nr:hypothetical protein [Pseudonocardiaceae bacterium]
MTGSSPSRPGSPTCAAGVRFVTSGDPGWIRYDTTTRAVQTFFNAEKIEIVNDPRGDERELWKDFVTP